MIYQKSHDNRARFSLGKWGNRTLITLGVNPSTATDQKFDRTIQKVITFSERNDFDGWLMINLYPQRATSLSDLNPDMSLSYHRTNLKVVETLVRQVSQPIIWCAWGDAIEERPYLMNCLKDLAKSIDQYKPQYHRIGTLTQFGNPRHPSRLSYSQPMKHFGVKEYLHRCANGM